MKPPRAVLAHATTEGILSNALANGASAVLVASGDPSAVTMVMHEDVSGASSQ